MILRVDQNIKLGYQKRESLLSIRLIVYRKYFIHIEVLTFQVLHNADLCSALMSFEQAGILEVSHLP